MRKSFLTIAMLMFITSFISTSAFAGGAFREGKTWENPEGGTSGAAASGAYGPNGGTGSVRGYTSDGAGNVQTGSGRAFKTPAGTTGGRASTTTKNADGTGTRKSGFAADNAKGTIKSQGSASKTATGVEGNRSSSATSKTTGNSYSGSTNYEYDKTTDDGSVSHTGKCYDSYGNEIACPKSK